MYNYGNGQEGVYRSKAIFLPQNTPNNNELLLSGNPVKANLTRVS
jgi:hypothetical protein